MQCSLHDARKRQDAVAENIMAQVCQHLIPQKIFTTNIQVDDERPEG